MSLRHKQKHRARRNRFLQRCQHPGCKQDGMPCFMHVWDKQPEDYYCHEHAFDGGYCPCCCLFWGGIESFEFRPSGLCDQCHHQIMADSDEFIESDEIAYDESY